MNRKEFGELVTALCSQIIEPGYGTVKTLDRLRLSEETGLEVDFLGRLSRGEAEILREDVLLKLSNAFKLTSGERKEFFSAASGVGKNEILSRGHQPNVIMDYLINDLKQIKLPTYVIDSYCDVVAVNPAVGKILSIDDAGLNLNEMKKYKFGLNMLQFVFSKSAVKYYRTRMEPDDWDRYAFQNMMIFRTLTLQLRATVYFKELFKYLLSYNEFLNFWYQVFMEEQDHYVNNEYITFNSTKREKTLRFFSSSFTANTTSGQLYINTYVPTDTTTSDIFNDAIQFSGAGLLPLGDWPEKNQKPVKHF